MRGDTAGNRGVQAENGAGIFVYLTFSICTCDPVRRADCQAANTHWAAGASREGFLLGVHMATSKLQKYVSMELGKFMSEFLIYENIRPSWMSGLELDFYIPEISTAIEVQGDQHSKFTPHFHKNYDAFLDQLHRDFMKKQICEDHEITLFEVCNELDTDILIKTLFRKYHGINDDCQIYTNADQTRFEPHKQERGKRQKKQKRPKTLVSPMPPKKKINSQQLTPSIPCIIINPLGGYYKPFPHPNREGSQMLEPSEIEFIFNSKSRASSAIVHSVDRDKEQGIFEPWTNYKIIELYQSPTTETP